MPRRADIETILVIGSGPIVIGQACEFDYSGTQAVRTLRAEGYRIVLANSNPATIMTDPEFADRTYVEPLNLRTLTRIIEQEHPDVILPTVGGQTALNLTVQLADAGILKEFGVKLIGARLETIRVAEDRRLFAAAMAEIGLATPRGMRVTSLPDAVRAFEEVGSPAIIRPSFTLGGAGSGIAYNREEVERIVRLGLEESPVHEVIVEESVLGWKEYELEVMRDRADNFVVICPIENVDPMGVHTGDSITVAPALTLTDREYQILRNQARQVLNRVGVETGGANVQFAVHPEDGRVLVIEMNPRVSRSSALASKATGFPIAKIAAKLAVGYTLDEIPNDITRKTTASFEPTIDYHVVKIPRFAFEKFSGSDDTITTQMKSVGETMAIGRTFQEALQKGLRSLETGQFGLCPPNGCTMSDSEIRQRLITPNARRLEAIVGGLKGGMPIDEIHALCRIDRWFLHQIADLLATEDHLQTGGFPVPSDVLFAAKRQGFSDRRLAQLTDVSESTMRHSRIEAGIVPVYKTVDTCGGEFPASTPYHYSTYEEENESIRSDRRKVLILGGGPNRIGQGIEFDYCCVQASLAMREEGFETIMLNNNPETVSTDYDISDKLYFEPLTLEDVQNVIDQEHPDGVIVQFGGQTPLRLALELQGRGVPIIGTSPDAIDLAEDRQRCGRLLDELGIRCPANGTARSLDEAKAVARQIGYPVLVRPSYVLGGRAMVVVYDDDEMGRYFGLALEASDQGALLIDRFLEDAFEVDIDALCDGVDVVIGGIMQHIEEAGVHSGDSSCVLPSYLIPAELLDVMREQTRRMALALQVKGLVNIQFAIKDSVVYVLEINPRASRTVPFVSKATGVPLARLAAKILVGRTLRDLGITAEPVPVGYFVKASVFPFKKFPGVDTLLGPEMRSTGEVMGAAPTFGGAFAKSQQGAGFPVPLRGTVYITVNDHDKPTVLPIARALAGLGFHLVATRGTAEFLRRNGLECGLVNRMKEGRPHALDLLKDGQIDIVINTPLGRESFRDDMLMRRECHAQNVLLLTTMSAARATLEAIRSLRQNALEPVALQDIYPPWRGTSPAFDAAPLVDARLVAPLPSISTAEPRSRQRNGEHL
ncbi:MAG: carbamoyl-phosphate synthase large subunit [candidate division Zixibacteria bacterium]|nr:carbamoyl-phosphate synthase large subunit [candidate division Zixibacteria bacterium]